MIWLDPNYFFEEFDSGAFKDQGPSLYQQACELYAKARHIRPPQKYPEGTLVAHNFHPSSGKLATLDLVGELNGHRQGINAVFHSPVVDMRVPRELCRNDRLSYRAFLRDVKFILFGNCSHRMTQKRCEEFFEDEANFMLREGSMNRTPEGPRTKRTDNPTPELHRSAMDRGALLAQKGRKTLEEIEERRSLR